MMSFKLSYFQCIPRSPNECRHLSPNVAYGYLRPHISNNEVALRDARLELLQDRTQGREPGQSVKTYVESTKSCEACTSTQTILYVRVFGT